VVWGSKVQWRNNEDPGAVSPARGVADEESVDVTQPTEPAAASDTLDALIDEALTARQILPTRDRCEHLNHELRAALDRLIPAVQAQADGMDRGDVAWWVRQRALDETANTLAEGLGLGLVSAATHVHELARYCRVLADYASR
jgi:hypothetical protein